VSLEEKMQKLLKTIKDYFPNKRVVIEVEDGEIYWEVYDNKELVSEKKTR
jgi:hypothetical protein